MLTGDDRGTVQILLEARSWRMTEPKLEAISCIMTKMMQEMESPKLIKIRK